MSALRSEPTSPMATSTTPLRDPCEMMGPGLDQDCGSSGRPGASRGTTTDSRRCQKPPPLHTGADWKVVLHLPEIEKWLRAAGDRVNQLSHSVSQDRDGRHVDTHLLQLKDICEDISDHVEQIHALLETEFSLKLLSYSVNIIVDIRSVQLLWHQLRVSVLVLKERLLQGLQDSNGNFTRQTDILQAFNQHTETRLEELTEEDDCGALTIRCSRDYFSLDCGITAFELCDYSPSEENQPTHQSNRPKHSDSECSDRSDLSDPEEGETDQCSGESTKRSHSVGGSPTHQSKRAALVLEGTRPEQATLQSERAERTWTEQEEDRGAEIPRTEQEEDRGVERPRTEQEEDRGGERIRTEQGEDRGAERTRIEQEEDREARRKRIEQGENRGTERTRTEQEEDRLAEKTTTEQEEDRGPERTRPEQEEDRGVERTRTEQEEDRGAERTRPEQEEDRGVERTRTEQEEDRGVERTRTEQEEDRGVERIRPKQEGDKGAERTRPEQEEDKGAERTRPEQEEDRGAERTRIGQEEDRGAERTRPDQEEDRGAEPRHHKQDEAKHSCLSNMETPEKLGIWLELNQGRPRNKHFKSPSITTGESVQTLPHDRSSSVDSGSSCSPLCGGDEAEVRPAHAHSGSSDMEASAEESRPSSSETRSQEDQIFYSSSPQHWFGSEEFLALPAQLRKTEMLTMDLESLAKSMSLGLGRCDPSHDAVQDVDDWDLTELNSDWETLETGVETGSSVEESEDPSPLARTQFPFRRQPLPRRFSPSSSSDVAPSLDESLESGRISELHSEDEAGPVHRGITAPPADAAGKYTLQKLLQQIHLSDQEPQVWIRVESLVQKLDGFISWLQDSLDSTENWTQPRQDPESLKAYLSTHLSFKLDVDLHSSLRDQILEEGRLLLSCISSHHSALRDILHMVSSQWDQLQRQIRRQHGWMLRALRCVQARLFYQFDQSHQPLSSPATNHKTAQLSEGPKDLLYGQFETQRAALEQMAVRLSSLQYPSPTSRRSSAQTKANSLQQLEAEYQELSDWLMDMDAMVTDSHQLMMSEEQRIHLFKSSHAELQMMESRRSSLLSRLDLFRRSGPEPPRDLVHKVHSLNQTWDQIKNLLCVDSSGRCPSLLSAAPLVTAGHYTLSPLTTSLLQQLEARIKELKSWLRDTELLIFNSCLCNHKEPEQQLASFKSLCADIRARRRAVASVLKLCQKLLQQNQVSPTLELGPEAQQHQEALLLLSINLERRWEAIVMQALQWQNRLRREMGEEQVPGNFLEPGLVDLHQITSVQNTATPGMLTDDSWEWDETDMTLSDSNEDTPEPVQDPNQEPNHNQRNAKVYQVYSLHHVEREPLFPLENGKNKKHKFLAKSLSKDSSFSSVESLPDVLGGILKHKQDSWNKKSKSEFECGISVSSRRSGSESGIDTGDTETITSEIQDYEEGKREDRCKLEGFGNHKEDLGSLCRDSERMEDFASSYMKKKRSRKSGEAVEMLINGRGILTPADSDSDLDFESMKQLQENRSSPVLSHGSSLESLLALGVELFPSQHGAYRSIDDSNEETAEREESESVKSEELSRRTLELLKRLENIQSPLGGSLTRSVSDMALVSMSPNRIPASPSLGGKISPLSGIAFHLSPPSLIHEGSATASLTELSSAEEVSQASADFKSRFLDPANAANTANANFYCRKQVNRLEEMDGASLSMVVNVSSACTDDEDDNSDLLSASTLTEEELGVRDEDEERFSVASSANEDDLDSPFGLDVMQKELQHWIRTPFSRSEKGLTDELQCGANVRSESAETTTTCSQLPISKRHRSAQENRRSATRSYISRYADDVENGNVEQSWERRRDADEELLREEASVFTKTPARDLFVCTHTEEPPHDVSEDADKTPLVEQLQGELPCHSSLTQTQRVPQGTSPLQKTNARKAITIQERFKFMSLVTEQARREVREGGAKRRHGSHCCGHRPGSSSFSEETRPNEENVHDFVMEIMDLTNARKNRAQTQTQMQTQAGTQGATIRDKVLDHTHRSVQLRRGDFYSYLSLSSHDSDCGEVLQLNNTSPTPELTASPHSPTSPSPDPFPTTDPCPSPDLCPSLEQFDKPADMVHPLSPDIRDEEKLFPACTEEVYLGPPLCYSLSAPRGQRGVLQTKRTPSLKCDPGNVRSVGLSYYSVLQREDTGGCQSSRLFSEGGVRAMTP